MPHSVKATSKMPDFTSQEILDGRFCLLDLLGAGSYGKVYKARDNRPRTEQSPRFYAIKVLRKADTNSRESDMQLRELRLQKKVSHHPNIVTFCGAFEEGDYFFVVLDLCEGYDLFTAIADVGLFDGNNELIKSCYVKILDAVHFCHQQGVYHRDLKPENILCSKNGRDIWLADFGLATNRRACCDFGCGSSAYMSPECIGKETNNVVYSALHNDIWSLGVILVNLVTRHNPWGCAQSSDPCFDAFLLDRNSIRNALPISDALHHLLKRIFHLNPIARISIPFLRNEILAVETFYASDEKEDSILVPSSPIPNIQVAVDVEFKVEEFKVEDSFSGESSSDDASPSWSSADSEEVEVRILKGNVPPSRRPRPELFVVGSVSSYGSNSSQLVDLLIAPHGTANLPIEVRGVDGNSHQSSSTTESSASSSKSCRSLRRRPRFAVDPRVGFKQEAEKLKLEIVAPEPVYPKTRQSLKDVAALVRFSV
ncbi:hypothetical protein GYMLUDRAFT_245173 [Collybiopsis luxurians FD-317 M1]|uniref:non-specific serine/threonine protein kinase n=1 Tax=Collybiopsis luxurians FD-317 M1 TaxID=944289 RepID=A0A0D0CLR1_9AGAR|nr:hypothetical protein GYMLUDRAFT_245173 [Collybiopsis luxurians FD-317 M1]